MQKRGSNQIDWAISLAMFLLYLAWFFILAKPQLDDTTDIGTLADSLLLQIVDNTSWEVKTIPLFVTASETGVNQPMIIDFPFEWSETQFAFNPSNYFALDNDELYLLGRADELEFTMWILSSDSEYSPPDISKDIEIGSNYARVAQKGFEIEFQNSTPVNISRNNVRHVSNYNLYVNGQLVSGNSSFSKSSIHGKHVLASDEIVHSTLVFAERPQALLDFDLTSMLEHTITLELELFSFSNYYLNSESQGNINYNGSCTLGNSSQVELHSLTRGVFFTSDKNMSVSICPINNSAIGINLSIVSNEDFEVLVSTHLGLTDFQNWESRQIASPEVIPYYSRPTHTNTGTALINTGLNSRFVDELDAFDYDDLKLLWGFPDANDFSVSISNGTNSILGISEPLPLETDTVLVRQRKMNLINQNGTKNPYTISVRVW